MCNWMSACCPSRRGFKRNIVYSDEKGEKLLGKVVQDEECFCRNMEYSEGDKEVRNAIEEHKSRLLSANTDGEVLITAEMQHQDGARGTE